MNRTGKFTISLDFELLWGMRDHADKVSYGKNILGVRDAIPRMLGQFEKFGIHATWATIGMLICESKEELLQRSPKIKPVYDNMSLSNYSYLDEVGENEKTDPYYFGSSLFTEVQQCPDQEIGTHTYSHYYCLENGQKDECFRADLMSAMKLFEDRGVKAKSIVFPRNQISGSCLKICSDLGLTHFRGTERNGLYEARNGTKETKIRRLGRLADAYVNISGHGTSTPNLEFGMINVPSSRFLRPYSKRLSALERVRLNRIKTGMTLAAVSGEVYHLWWHPHNFGANTTDNMEVLEHLISHFVQLQDTYGYTSATMGELS